MRTIPLPLVENNINERERRNYKNVSYVRFFFSRSLVNNIYESKQIEYNKKCFMSSVFITSLVNNIYEMKQWRYIKILPSFNSMFHDNRIKRKGGQYNASKIK